MAEKFLHVGFYFHETPDRRFIMLDNLSFPSIHPHQSISAER